MTCARGSIASTVFAAAALAIACGGGTGDDPGTDGRDNGKDTGSAGDTAAMDTGTGTADVLDGGAPEACLATLSGRVLRDGESGMTAVIVLCVGLTCYSPVVTASDGAFTWEHPLSDGEICRWRDFAAEGLHIEVAALDEPDNYASYAFKIFPTQEDISDEGEDDYDLNLGELFLYALSDAIAIYEPEAGATVGLGDLSFELPPQSIVKRVLEEDVPIDHSQAIHVFEAPLDEWEPPFAPAPLDRLFFIAPRWAKLASPGVALHIEMSDWTSKDEGALFLLGGYTSSYGDEAVRDRSAFIYRDADGECVNADDHDALEQVDDGIMAPCGSVSGAGTVTTAPIPRFTWVGIAKR